jgi:hypothetical protein
MPSQGSDLATPMRTPPYSRPTVFARQYTGDNLQTHIAAFLLHLVDMLIEYRKQLRNAYERDRRDFRYGDHKRRGSSGRVRWYW